MWWHLRALQDNQSSGIEGKARIRLQGRWKQYKVIYLCCSPYFSCIIMTQDKHALLRFNSFENYRFYSINWKYLRLLWNLRRLSALTFMITLSLQIILYSITETLYSSILRSPCKDRVTIKHNSCGILSEQDASMTSQNFLGGGGMINRAMS